MYARDALVAVVVVVVVVVLVVVLVVLDGWMPRRAFLASFDKFNSLFDCQKVFPF